MTHIIRLVRTGLFLLATVAALSLVSGLVYLNQVGFPGAYGDWISDELDDLGIHISFETLRYDMTKGIVATNVSVFQTKERVTALLEADEVILDLDKSKAMLGHFKLLGLKVTNGSTQLPLKDEDRSLSARQIFGTLEITDSNYALLRKTEAMIEGIRVKISGDLKLQDPKEKTEQGDTPDTSNQIVRKLLDELTLWDLPADEPPNLSFHVEGDLNEPEQIQSSFEFQATNLGRNQYRLEEIKIAGDLRAEVITLDEILIRDRTGELSGQADWCFHRRNGRFDLVSTLDPKALFGECFETEILPEFTPLSPPSIEARGRFMIASDGKLSVTATGRAALSQFSYRETSYEKLNSEFSWRNGDLFLRNLSLSHEGQSLTGNLIIEENQARFDARTSFYPKAFDPLIKPESELEQELAKLELFPNSSIETVVRGTINRNDPKDWSATGNISIKELAYKGTKGRYLSTSFELGAHQSTFSDTRFLLNDDHEKARSRYRGKASSEILADRVLFDSTSGFITITNLRGQTWPTPIVQIFAPNTAQHLEENYRFYQPPKLTLNGRFANRSENNHLTSFSVGVTTTGQTDYPFLGSELPLTELKADIMVKGKDLTVKNMTAKTLRGTLSGSVVCDLKNSKETTYRGSLKWDQVSFRELSRVYKFDEEESGTLTGGISFAGVGGQIRKFNANGALAIKGGNLVSIPILGPLSPLISGILSDKRMGYERAKDATAHFNVHNGVLQTDDFVAISRNITLTGQGWIDLDNDKIDMVVRVNARGLLGVLALPLQPFRGLFQFRGIGTYDKPTWKSAPFTSPPKGQGDPLFGKAKRAKSAAN